MISNYIQQIKNNTFDCENMMTVIQKADLALVKDIIALNNEEYISELLRTAVYCNRQDIVEVCHNMQVTCFTDEHMDSAASAGI